MLQGLSYSTRKHSKPFSAADRVGGMAGGPREDAFSQPRPGTLNDPVPGCANPTFKTAIRNADCAPPDLYLPNARGEATRMWMPSRSILAPLSVFLWKLYHFALAADRDEEQIEDGCRPPFAPLLEYPHPVEKENIYTGPDPG